MTAALKVKLADEALMAAAPALDDGPQLAFDLFTNLAPGGIENTPRKVGFQRNNIFVNITDLGLSARRAIDVAYFIVTGYDTHLPRYDVDLNYFKWLMGYGSRNHKHLKSVIGECQSAKLQVEDLSNPDESTRKWSSVQLIYSVDMENGRLIFEIPWQLYPHIKNPVNWHYLSLRYVFKSLHAKVLYDKLLPHIQLTTTGWISLETFRTWMGLEEDSYAEFKRLRSKVIVPAVEQINQITDLNVSFATRNLPGTKKVGFVAFRIHTSKTVDDVVGPLQILAGHFEVLQREFGLNGAQLLELAARREEYTYDRISRGIEYTRFQIAQGKVKSPAGYVINAIKGDFTLGEHTKTIALQREMRDQVSAEAGDGVATAIATQKTLEFTKRAAAAKIGYEGFQSLPLVQQDELLSAFARSSAAKVLAMKLKVSPKELQTLHTEDAEVRDLLGSFVAQRATKQAGQPKRAVAS